MARTTFPHVYSDEKNARNTFRRFSYVRGNIYINAIIPVILLRRQENMLEYIYRESPARSQIFIIGKSIQCLGALFYAIKRQN